MAWKVKGQRVNVEGKGACGKGWGRWEEEKGRENICDSQREGKLKNQEVWYSLVASR